MIRLYTLCERKAGSRMRATTNELVTAWNGMEQVSRQVGIIGTQTVMDV